MIVYSEFHYVDGLGRGCLISIDDGIVAWRAPALCVSSSRFSSARAFDTIHERLDIQTMSCQFSLHLTSDTAALEILMSS